MMSQPRQKLTPCLWFAAQAEEAARFYVSLFPHSRINTISHFPPGGPAPAGTVMTVEFTLAGVDYLALNCNPGFAFSESISLSVDCENQAEIDTLWAKLSDGGTPGPCGWLKDRYGLSWQIVPHSLPAMMTDPDTVKAQRVMTTLMTMTKLDIRLLEDAYHNR